MFSSEHFRSDNKFRDVSANAAALRAGDKGYPVCLLQQGLIDCGYPLPTSTSKYRAPDGVFGNETEAAVARLQKKLSLHDDGVVGFKSVKKFDVAFSMAPAGFSPPPALPKNAQGGQGNPATKVKEIVLEVIGPGSPIFQRDWEVKWRPSPKSRELIFKMQSFAFYGLGLNRKIIDGKINFAFLDRPNHSASAAYVSNRRRLLGAQIEPNTVLLLKKSALLNMDHFRNLMLHELTHAVLDMERAARNHLFNEIIAYIAMVLFAELSAKVKFGTNPFNQGLFREASKCVFYVRARAPIPQERLDALAKEIEARGAYRHSRHGRVVNNGI